MRVSSDTLESLRVIITPLDTDERRSMYRARDERIPRIQAVRDIDKRYRWDLFYDAKGYRALPEDDTLTVTHIDTALRSIVHPLG